MNQRFKVLEAMKGVMRCRTMDLEAMRGLYEGVIVSTVHYGAGT